MRKIISLTVVSALLLALAPGLALARQEGADAPTPGMIRGTLVDANGQPLAGYILKVTDAQGNSFQSEATGPDGKYEVSDLPAGTYTYEIIDPEGKIVAVRMPPVNLESGTVLTQPLAIVPKSGNKKKVLAWTLGGAGALLAAIIIANNNDHNNNRTKKMTPSGT